MNYYPFHIGDYASKTRHLSWDENMAYRLLLDLYYASERPIPKDMRAVFRLLMASTDAQREAVTVVLQEFFEATDDGWRNPRADTEIEAMRTLQEKQRDKAFKRWHKPATEHGTAPAMPRHETNDAAADATASKSDADAMPPTPTPTPTPKIKDKGAAALTVDALVSDGLTEQTAGEFIAHRKAKGARLTARAWQGVKAEAGKAGWPVEQAVCKALARGWTGFEAAWVASERPAARDAEPAWRTEQRNRVAEFAGPAAAKRPVTMEVVDVAARRLG
jgi:uncharacterized protein YdaU (DUF1376 family)